MPCGHWHLQMMERRFTSVLDIFSVLYPFTGMLCPVNICIWISQISKASVLREKVISVLQRSRTMEQDQLLYLLPLSLHSWFDLSQRDLNNSLSNKNIKTVINI